MLDKYRPFNCGHFGQRCGNLKFHSLGSLVRHIEIVHWQLVYLLCPRCNIGIAKNYFVSHIKRDHPTETIVNEDWLKSDSSYRPWG